MTARSPADLDRVDGRVTVDPRVVRGARRGAEGAPWRRQEAA